MADSHPEGHHPDYQEIAELEAQLGIGTDDEPFGPEDAYARWRGSEPPREPEPAAPDPEPAAPAARTTPPRPAPPPRPPAMPAGRCMQCGARWPARARECRACHSQRWRPDED